MASPKPESQFINRVHKHLPTVYKEKMNNPYRSGTADVWYSGRDGDLWVEYKYMKELPKRKTEIALPLTPRQRKWLNDRADEGRNVAVVLGTANGAAILTGGSWEYPFPTTALLCSVEYIAHCIRRYTGDSPCLLPKG